MAPAYSFYTYIKKRILVLAENKYFFRSPLRDIGSLNLCVIYCCIQKEKKKNVGNQRPTTQHVFKQISTKSMIINMEERDTCLSMDSKKIFGKYKNTVSSSLRDTGSLPFTTSKAIQKV